MSNTAIQSTFGSKAQEQTGAPGTTDRFDVRRIISIAWRRKFLIAGVTLLFVLAGLYQLSRVVPIYTTSATIMLNNRETRVIDIESVVSGLPTNNAAVGSEIQLLRSTQLLERVVEKLRLERDPEFNYALRPRVPYATLYGLEKVLPQSAIRMLTGADGKVVQPPPFDSFDPDGPEMQAVKRGIVGTLRGNMTAGVVPGTMAIRVGYSSPDPGKAQLIANTIAEQYIIDQLEAKYEATRRATSWLNERLEDLKSQVEEKEGAVAAFKARQTNRTGQGVELTSQQLTQLNSELVLARAARAEAEARYRQVAGEGTETAAESLSSPLVESLRQKLADLERQDAELSTRYAERHPRILNVRAELADTRAAINREVEKVVRSLRTELNVASAREQALQRSVSQLEQRAISQDQSSVELRQLEREAEATRVLYTSFLSRFKETSEQGQIQQADSRIISQAERPGRPASPNRSQSMLIVTILGLAVSFGLVLLLEQLDNAFRSPEQLESVLGLVTLGSIPLVKGFRKNRADVLQYVSDKPTSGLAEACRSMRVSLMLSNVDKPPRVVLVTSSLPSEGKSTTSVLLAQAVASQGKKSIIIDCDLRRPSLHHTLRLDNSISILDVLTGRHELDEAIHKDHPSGVHALPAKETAAQAIDLLSSRAFDRMVETLKETYDTIVLDAAPTLAVSDALVISQISDAVIYVIKWDDTPREVVKSGLDRLKENGVRVTGAVLAQMNMSKQARYGYYYSGASYYYGKYKNYYKN
ncbi:MAG: polysaccharide biosynthesis tyrosine autokinase [Minwuia sp.]|nr:polysaccharide biosynthesis tyrosine autokinase [Minwuia sp.]